MLRLRKLNRTGDTIVEVLIVIIVIGAVLASTYAVAVSSLQSTQLSQERAYALKLAEAQVETLKAVAGDDNPFIRAILDTNSNGYCLTSDPISAPTIPGGSPTVNLADDNFSNYPAACKNDPNNASPTCSSYCYYIGVTKLGTALAEDHKYTVSVRWFGPRGNRQQVQLAYKVYKND